MSELDFMVFFSTFYRTVEVYTIWNRYRECNLQGKQMFKAANSGRYWSTQPVAGQVPAQTRVSECGTIKVVALEVQFLNMINSIYI